VKSEFKKYWSRLLETADSGVEFGLALDHKNGWARIQRWDKQSGTEPSAVARDL